jgi:Ca2+-binding EF-hand superfamily protein
MGTYIIVGVPLFAYTVGQFAGLIVEHAVKAKEQKLMVRPLTEAEFTFARQLRKGVLHHRDDDNSDFNSKNGNKGNSENGISTGRTDEALCRISEGSGDFSSRVLPPPLPPPPPPPVSKHASPAVTREAMTIDLGEFILLELLRLQKVDMTDLLCLKALFDEIDDSGDGVIDMEEMRRHNLAVLARGDTDRKGHQTIQQQFTSKHALLSGADKFSYGALNQQDFACDTPNNTVVSGSGSNLSGLASESSLAECSSPSVTICAAEEGRYHDHQFNEHINANNTIEDETANGMDEEEEERATNYSDMYNSMVIPVIQQLHEQSLWNMPPLNTDGDAFDDQERSPVPPALKFLSGRARRNTLWSSVELLTRSSSDKSNRESSALLGNSSVKQKKKAMHFEVSAGRSRSSTTGSVASNDLTQQM